MADAVLKGLRLLLRVLPRPLRERLAVRLTVTAYRYPEPDREQVIREQGEPVEVQGMRGTAFGKGPTVILLHGWAGRGLQLSAFIEPLTGAGYRVVALDAPGHGRSEGTFTGLPTWVPALDRLIRQDPPAAFITHSFGGLAAIMAAQWADYKGKILCIAGPPEMEWAVLSGRRVLGLGERDFEYYLRLAERVYKDDVQRYRTHTLGASPATVHALLAENDDEFDEAMPRRMMERVGGTAEVLPGLGHKNIMWSPEAVAKGVVFVQAG